LCGQACHRDATGVAFFMRIAKGEDSMRFNPFESQLERLARTLTDSFGVSVVCQGENAYTDGRQIVLPSLPDPMEPRLERMIIGFLDHESAHVVWSDFSEVEKFNRKYPGCEAMLNVVEDALIEQLAMQRWPGVRANLDALFSQVKGRVRSALKRASPFRRFCTAVYLKLSHHSDMLGLAQEIVGYEDLLDAFPKVKTTADSAVLSEKLLNRWIRNWRQKNSAPKPQKEQPNTNANNGDQTEADSNSDGDTATGQETGDANPSSGSRDDKPEGEEITSQPAESGNEDISSADSIQSGGDNDDASSDCQQDAGSGASRSDAEPPATLGGQGSGSGAGDQADSSPSVATCDSTHADDDDDDFRFDPAEVAYFSDGASGATLIIEVVTNGIERAVAKVDGDRCYRVFTRKHDRIEVVPSARDVDVQSLLSRGEDEVRRLRRGLANALRSAEKRWWRDEQPRGSLSPKSLHRLCVDRPSLDVFRTRAVVQGKSTAVSIVLDASGSMTPSKMDMARDAVRVILQALSDLRIPSEAFTFTTGDLMGIHEAANQTGIEAGKLKKRFTRLSNLEIGLIKRFEDSVKTAIQRLPSIRGSGLTPLGEAMEIGARRLVVRPENRKIQLVVTDGRPACEGSDNACRTHACQIAKRIASAGIELVGVGILDDSLQHIISDTIVVNRIEDLPARLCKLFGRTLQKGVRRVG